MAFEPENQALWEFVPPAERQTAIPSKMQMNTANAGVIIVRQGQIKNLYRHEARVFAADVSEYINRAQVDVVTVYNYEETFGTQDRIYWLIHMKSLDDYVKLLMMGKEDEKFQEIFMRDRISAEKGYGKWDKMFVDAGFHETVLTAHHWGSHGTGVTEKETRPGSVVAPAIDQTDLRSDEVFHSGNAGAMILRSGQVKGEFRAEGREFAREVVSFINKKQAGRASTFLYEEHFGRQDRIHWVTSMRNLGEYHAVCAMGTMDDDFREIFTRERIPAEKGGGTWDKIFVEGSIEERVLMPQHPLKGC